MKKKYVRILIVILLLGGAALFYGLKEYNRGHKDASKHDADFAISATELFQKFSTDENAANGMYLDKTIEISGIVKSVDKDETGNYTIQLESGDMMSSVSCQMDTRHNADAEKVKAGETVKIKGTCTGILMDVILIRCVLSN